MGESLGKFEKSVLVYYQMLTNAFMDEEDYEVAYERVRLNQSTNLNEEIVAMVAAIKIFCEKVNPELFEHDDLLGFTHTLNRLVVQHAYGVDTSVEDEDGGEDE